MDPATINHTGISTSSGVDKFSVDGVEVSGDFVGEVGMLFIFGEDDF